MTDPKKPAEDEDDDVDEIVPPKVNINVNVNEDEGEALEPKRQTYIERTTERKTTDLD